MCAGLGGVTRPPPPGPRAHANAAELINLLPGAVFNIYTGDVTIRIQRDATGMIVTNHVVEK